jgi:hypothetical protein
MTHPSRKLWKIIKEPSGYYFEIKLDGVVIDRIKVEYGVEKFLKQKGEL